MIRNYYPDLKICYLSFYTALMQLVIVVAVVIVVIGSCLVVAGRMHIMLAA